MQTMQFLGIGYVGTVCDSSTFNAVRLSIKYVGHFALHMKRNWKSYDYTQEKKF